MFTATMIITATFRDIDTTSKGVDAVYKEIERCARETLFALGSPALIMDDEKDVVINYTITEMEDK